MNAKFVLATAMVLCFAATLMGGQTMAPSWEPPTENTDGTALTNLAGYKIYMGHKTGIYTETTDVGNVTSCLVPDRTGLVYFAIAPYNTEMTEGDLSAEKMWAAFAPSNPVVSKYTFTLKSGLFQTTASVPTKNSDGKSCAGQIAGYIIGYGKVSREVQPYSMFYTSSVASASVSIPTNSGLWYASEATLSIYGSVGPYGPEMPFGLAPKPIFSPIIVGPLDLRSGGTIQF